MPNTFIDSTLLHTIVTDAFELQIAIETAKKNPENLKELLKSNRTVHQTTYLFNGVKQRPIFYAVTRGFSQAVSLFLEHDPIQSNWKDSVTEYSLLDIAYDLNQSEITHILLRYGANPYEWKGLTERFKITTSHDLDIVQFLVINHSQLPYVKKICRDYACERFIAYPLLTLNHLMQWGAFSIKDDKAYSLMGNTAIKTRSLHALKTMLLSATSLKEYKEYYDVLSSYSKQENREIFRHLMSIDHYIAAVEIFYQFSERKNTLAWLRASTQSKYDLTAILFPYRKNDIDVMKFSAVAEDKPQRSEIFTKSKNYARLFTQLLFGQHKSTDLIKNTTQAMHLSGKIFDCPSEILLIIIKYVFSDLSITVVKDAKIFDQSIKETDEITQSRKDALATMQIIQKYHNK